MSLIDWIGMSLGSPSGDWAQGWLGCLFFWWVKGCPQPLAPPKEESTAQQPTPFIHLFFNYWLFFTFISVISLSSSGMKAISLSGRNESSAMEERACVAAPIPFMFVSLGSCFISLMAGGWPLASLRSMLSIQT